MSASLAGKLHRAAATVQMAVEAWRMEIAGQILINGDWMKCASVSPPAAAGGDAWHLGAPTSVTFLGEQ
ncbi:hypothetical protein CN153_21940 [Sinorhizobium meliloti]|nr:hypothetical protein CN199_24475 [Sinorhizobium meliloti]RVK27476.1 hypothetical protein CN161_28760 [Sinorhizobium meliloti]RVK83650.1 hypothetical protein CN153_21940 [Sinorhizobium meliloti]RVL18828.1 hypothetical protein CN143_18030 [Sinorhizobium meliloti]RVO36697.1 hypothetical protein CN093_21950 [Sinorhizobium meliloti]